MLNYQEENKEIALEVDSRIYSKRVVMESAVKFMDKCYIRIEAQPNHIWRLIFNKKEPQDKFPSNLVNTFQNELLERQLRFELEESFKEIREMIVRQAFWPFEPGKK